MHTTSVQYSAVPRSHFIHLLGTSGKLLRQQQHHHQQRQQRKKRKPWQLLTTVVYRERKCTPLHGDRAVYQMCCGNIFVVIEIFVYYSKPFRQSFIDAHHLRWARLGPLCALPAVGSIQPGTLNRCSLDFLRPMTISVDWSICCWYARYRMPNVCFIHSLSLCLSFTCNAPDLRLHFYADFSEVWPYRFAPAIVRVYCLSVRSAWFLKSPESPEYHESG